MTGEEAASVVESNRTRLGLDPAFRLEGLGRALVEYKRDRERPGPTENRVAWVLRYVSMEGFAEVQIEDGTGEILHVRRTP